MYKIEKPKSDGRLGTMGHHFPDGNILVLENAHEAENFKEFGYLVKTTTVKPGLYAASKYPPKVRKPRAK